MGLSFGFSVASVLNAFLFALKGRKCHQVDGKAGNLSDQFNAHLNV